MASLSNFKSALQYGGARRSLFDFQVYDVLLTGVTLTNTPLYCNVSSIPPLTVTPIEKQYFGRTVKIPGDIVYGDLTTTFINTEDYKIRNSIETWMDHINKTTDNSGFADNDSWVSSADLRQYSKDGFTLITYLFFDIWPTTLTEIALSHDTASDIEQFDVTWAYNYYTTGDVSDRIDNGNQG